MTGLEPLALTAVQALGSDTVHGSASLARRGRVAREQRMEAYLRLQQAVDQVALRASFMLALHSSRTNPLDPIAMVGGYRVVLTSMERLTADLTHAVDAARRVRLIAPDPVADAATDLVEALSERISNVDPGWLRPRRRRQHRVADASASERLVIAGQAFDRIAKADAAPTRAARKAARVQAKPCKRSDD